MMESWKWYLLWGLQILTLMVLLTNLFFIIKT